MSRLLGSLFSRTLGDLVEKNVKDDKGHEHGQDGRFVTTGGSSYSHEMGLYHNGRVSTRVKDSDGVEVGHVKSVYGSKTEPKRSSHYPHDQENVPIGDGLQHVGNQALGHERTRLAAARVVAEHNDGRLVHERESNSEFAGRVARTEVEPPKPKAHEHDQKWDPEKSGGKWGDAAGARAAGERAKAYIAKADPKTAALKDSLKGLFSDKGRVMARTKTFNSLMLKLEKETGKSEASQLLDVSAGRVILRSLDDVKAAVEQVRKNYKVTREKDAIANPLGDYRSHHFNVDLGDGVTGEIQIRTENMNKWADWAHNSIYKDLHPRAALIRRNRPIIDKYAHEASEYLHDQDLGAPKGLRMPTCSNIIRISTGCIS